MSEDELNEQKIFELERKLELAVGALNACSEDLSVLIRAFRLVDTLDDYVVNTLEKLNSDKKQE